MQYPACFLGPLDFFLQLEFCTAVFPLRSSLSLCLREAGVSDNYSLHAGSEWVLGFVLIHVNELVLINLIVELISKELFTAGC